MLFRLLALLVSLSASIASAGNPPLFKVTHPDQPGEILLAGTVHFLPDAKTASPVAFDRAYERADRVIFELDMTQDMQSMGMQMIAPAQDEADGLLGALLDDRKRKAMERSSRELELPLAQLAGFEPWFVTLQFNAILLTRLGMDAESGVESVYVAKAVKDGKPVSGLETVTEQVAYFDELPDHRQVVMLEQLLDDADTLPEEMRSIVNAWKNGDDRKLDAIMQESWQDAADFAEALMYRRNRKWALQLASELEKPGVALAMVGAGHLVGAESVPDLLRKRGYTVERL